MQAERFEANYSAPIEIDVCQHCNGLWFDGRESLMLTPGSTLRLFSAMFERREVARQPLVDRKCCPRCASVLKETFDRQRGTQFTYFRCETHGRYTTFFQFLREKNLVRAPSPSQLAELTFKVKQVSCSNCGSPIELAKTSVCPHCQAPVSILSEDSIHQTLKELQTREEKRTTVDPTLAARLVMDQMKVDRDARLDRARQLTSFQSSGWSTNVSAPTSGVAGDLVELGAYALLGAIRLFLT
jgi:hypothetical protein